MVKQKAVNFESAGSSPAEPAKINHGRVIYKDYTKLKSY